MEARAHLNNWTAVPLATLAIGSAMLLSGCAATESAVATSSSSPKTSHTTSQGNTSTPSPTPSSFKLEAAQQDISCAEILTPDALYELDQNLVIGGEASPALGAYAIEAAGLGITGCTITNLSSGLSVQVFVSKLTPASAEHMTAQVLEIQQASKKYEASIGVSGAYSSDGTVGSAQFMNKNYWVVIAEPMPGGNVNTAKLSNLIYTALQ